MSDQAPAEDFGARRLLTDLEAIPLEDVPTAVITRLLTDALDKNDPVRAQRRALELARTISSLPAALRTPRVLMTSLTIAASFGIVSAAQLGEAIDYSLGAGTVFRLRPDISNADRIAEMITLLRGVATAFGIIFQREREPNPDAEFHLLLTAAVHLCQPASIEDRMMPLNIFESIMPPFMTTAGFDFSMAFSQIILGRLEVRDGQIDAERAASVIRGQWIASEQFSEIEQALLVNSLLRTRCDAVLSTLVEIAHDYLYRLAARDAESLSDEQLDAIDMVFAISALLLPSQSASLSSHASDLVARQANLRNCVRIHLRAARDSVDFNALEEAQVYLQRAFDIKSRSSEEWANYLILSGILAYRRDKCSEARMLGEMARSFSRSANLPKCIESANALLDALNSLQASERQEPEAIQSSELAFDMAYLALTGGEPELAERYLRRAREIEDRDGSSTRVPLHLQSSRTALEGRVQRALGRYDDAIDLFIEASRLMIESLFHSPRGGDHRARVRLFQAIEGVNDSALACAVETGSDLPPEILQKLWQLSFAFREIEIAWFRVIRGLSRSQATGPPWRGYLDAYKACSEAIADSELDGPDAAAFPDTQEDEVTLEAGGKFFARLRSLYRERTAIESKLSHHPAFTRLLRSRLSLSPEQVMARLRPNDVLVEIVEIIEDQDGQAGTRDISRSRYVCFIARQTGLLMYRIGADRFRAAEDAFDAFSDVIREVVAGAKQRMSLFFVPDGIFRSFSIDAIPLDDGQFFADRHNVTYLAGTADLTEIGESPDIARCADSDLTVRGTRLVIGDPKFDLRDLPSATGNPLFLDLPGTAAEVRYVAELLRTEPVTGIRASRSWVEQNVRRPAVLHIASHGFRYDCLEWLPGEHSFLVTLAPSSSQMGRLPAGRVYDPLLATGLALAGVNHWLNGGDPNTEFGRGLLTAFDISWLDLTDTTVILSGCQTGSGSRERYRGMVDIRSALQAAGAANAVLSLWPVPDIATAIFMQFLYLISVERGRLDAESLRLAKVATRDLTVSKFAALLGSTTAGKSLLQTRFSIEVLRLPPSTKPLAQPRYWAGFAQYRL